MKKNSGFDKKHQFKKRGGKLTATIKKTSKKMVDKILLKLSPSVQEKIDKLMLVLQSGPADNAADLKLLASKILLRAQEISQSLRKKSEKKNAGSRAKKKRSVSNIGKRKSNSKKKAQNK